MMGEWIAIVAIVFSTLGWIVLILAFFWWRQRRLQVQAEVQGKLIDRFGSTPELIAFLNSEAGRSFVSGVQRGTMYAARERVLSGVRRGIVLSFLGIAFLAIGFVVGEKDMAWPGVLLLALGLGFLAATYASVEISKRFSSSEDASVSREP